MTCGRREKRSAGFRDASTDTDEAAADAHRTLGPPGRLVPTCTVPVVQSPSGVLKAYIAKISFRAIRSLCVDVEHSEQPKRNNVLLFIITTNMNPTSQHDQTESVILCGTGRS